MACVSPDYRISLIQTSVRTQNKALPSAKTFPEAFTDNPFRVFEPLSCKYAVHKCRTSPDALPYRHRVQIEYLFTCVVCALGVARFNLLFTPIALAPSPFQLLEVGRVLIGRSCMQVYIPLLAAAAESP